MKTAYRILLFLTALALVFRIFLCRGGVLVLPSTAAKGSSAATSGPTDAIAWYKFNNDLSDASPSGNNLSGVGSPAFATSQSGAANGAVVFDGSTQYAAVLNPANVPTGDFSFSLWCYETAAAVNAVPISIDSYLLAADRESIVINIDGSHFVDLVMFQGGNFFFEQGTVAISLNTWVHIAAIIHAGSGTTEVYINGVKDTGLNGTWNAGLPTQLNRFGIAGQSHINSIQELWPGRIDDARIYAHALTSTEVANLYAGQSARRRARPDFYLAFQPAPNFP